MRTQSIAWLLVCLVLISCTAQAETFPQRPLRIIVAFSPATAADLIARQLAAHLTHQLGKPVVVENREGASGTIGTALAAQSTPDGHTLLIASLSIMISPMLIKKLPYTVQRDFTPVSLMATFPTVLVVGAQIKSNTTKEFIDFLKNNSGKYNYATAGRGSASHLSAELLRRMSGIQVNEVSYRTTNQALIDTIGGEVGFYFPNLASALPHIKSGRLKALAVTSEKRLPSSPEIPALAETLPGYEAASWYGIVVPAKTPTGAVSVLYKAITQALQAADTQHKLIALGGTVLAENGQALGHVMALATTKWSAVIQQIEQQKP